MALELHDKVERIPVPAGISTNSAGMEQAHQALVALGFSSKDATAALEAAEQDSNSDDPEIQLRLALSRLR